MYKKIIFYTRLLTLTNKSGIMSIVRINIKVVHIAFREVKC